METEKAKKYLRDIQIDDKHLVIVSVTIIAIIAMATIADKNIVEKIVMNISTGLFGVAVGRMMK